MTTKSYYFWLTDAEIAKVRDSHIPDTFIPQIAKHLFLVSIGGENQQEAIVATLKAILEANQLLMKAIGKIASDETIQQELIPQSPIESTQQVKPTKESFFDQIKTLLTQHPNGLIVPEIATALSVSAPTVHRYIRLMEADGLINRKCSGIGRFTAYYLRGLNNE